MTDVGPKTSAPGTDPQAIGDPMSGIIYTPPRFEFGNGAPASPIPTPGNLFAPGAVAQQFRHFSVQGDFTDVLRIETFEPVVLWVESTTNETAVVTQFLIQAFPDINSDGASPVRNHGRFLFLPTPGTWIILAAFDPAERLALVEFPCSHPMVEHWFSQEQTASTILAGAVPIAAGTSVFIASGLDDVLIRVQNTSASPVRLNWGGAAAAAVGFLLPAATATQAPSVEYSGKSMIPARLNAFCAAAVSIWVERYQEE